MLKTISLGALALSFFVTGNTAPQRPADCCAPKAECCQIKASCCAKTAPKSFACQHCGRKMTAKTPADLKKKCTVCACGTTAEECQPKGGVK